MLSRFRGVLEPYGIVVPLMDDLSQLWDYFHSGFAVVCVVHNFRHATAGLPKDVKEGDRSKENSTRNCDNSDEAVLRAPDLSKVRNKGANLDHTCVVPDFRSVFL
jgi:hypothetical protein